MKSAGGRAFGNCRLELLALLKEDEVMRTRLTGLAVGILSLPWLAYATTYEIDPAHAAAHFAVRHMMVSTVRGEFGKVTGTITIDDKDLSHSSIDATIDVTTIDTRQSKRDEDLKSPNFFDAAKYPNMTFKSTSIKKKGTDNYTVVGDLTMHGVTKPVTLTVESPSKEVKDMQGKLRRGAHATTKLNRKDFGLTWNHAIEGGGVVVGDEIQVDLDVEMVKTGGEKAASAN
jgi:polyisoprenoid-binding protein YceI